jgi:uncharacterized repeat protein (TIGR04076 family)
MSPTQMSNEDSRGESKPVEAAFTKAEQAVLNELNWAKTCELVHAAPGHKLLRAVTPHDEQLYCTLVSDAQPWLIYHDPVRFVVTVHAAKGVCNAGHELGDRWEFGRCTPAGMCSSAYHTMYPVLHGLMLTSGRYEGPAADETLVSCPDGGWLTFRIERHHWTPAMWEEGENSEEGGRK